MSNDNPTKDNVESWLEIGTIVSPQGLKGELKVMSSTDFPERFEQPGQRWLQSPHQSSPQPVELLKGRQVPGKNLYVVRLTGIEDRNQAEALRGYKLLVPSSDRPPLEEDEYHVSELIDLAVYHQKTGELIGKITDIFGAGNDLLEVQLSQSFIENQTILNVKKSKQKKQNRVLIPFVYDIVPVVDLENQRVEIDPPKGLLDLTV